MYAKKEKIYLAYVSKHNANRKNQVIFLMISNRETFKAKFEGHEAKSKGRQRQWHVVVKKLSALLRGITSKYHRDF